MGEPSPRPQWCQVYCPQASARADTVTPEHPLERAALDAEYGRGARDVAARFLEDVREIAALHLFERRCTAKEHRIEVSPQLRRQVVGRQDVAVRERDGALDA